MADELQVARSLALPAEYVTQTGGLLAVRGAGKSNAARVMAEEMFRAGLPFCAIDPVGSWYGLRSGRDGTPAGGLPVFIFGGSHGDVSLNKDAGALVADVVVDQRLTCIVDLSGFEDDRDKKRFLLAFSKRLYFRNKDPLHMFLEEADDYIPQDMSDADRPLIKAWEDIVRRGRSRGIGCTIITQRSAAINKKVFTQVENLFVLRTTGPQDIKAIAEWVKYHKVKEELLDSLSGLDDGEAWVWSPHFLKQTKKFRFRVSNTFDSGATPKNFKGKTARKVATLRDVDVKKLNERISDTIEKVKSEDPTALRVELARLKAERHSLQMQVERLNKKPVTPSVDMSKLKRLQQTIDQGLRNLRSVTTVITSDVASELAELIPVANVQPSIRDTLHEPIETTRRPMTVRPIRSASAGSTTLAPTPKALLSVLCWAYPKALSFSGLSILSGYSSKSSGYVNALSTLRTAGLLSGSREDMKATDAGLKENGDNTWMGAQLGQELVDVWLGKLEPTPRRLLKALAEAYPAIMDKNQLSAATGLSLTSSGFVNGLSTLHTLQLVSKPEKGSFVLNSEFFNG